MKIHATLAISDSANNFLEIACQKLINSFKNLDVFFTIFIPENEKHIGKKLANKAELVYYKKIDGFSNPWECIPKWDISPKGDIVLGLDADIVLINQNNLLDQAKKSLEFDSIIGTIAYSSPFQNEIEWEILFKKFKMSDNFEYNYGDESPKKCPYYINNGAVLVPARALDNFRTSLRNWIIKLNKIKEYKANYYLAQIATTMAIKSEKISHLKADRSFNYIESIIKDNKDNLEELNNISMFHYNISKKYLPKEIEKIKFPFSKKVLKKHYKQKYL